jgi:hypothetical protein
MLSFTAAIAARRSARSLAARSVRYFADAAAAPPRPVRGTGISLSQRAALRAARKERATKMLEQQKAETSGTGGTSGSTGTSSRTNLAMSRYIWYLSVGVPSVLLVWGFGDENSPPAKLCRVVGLTDFIRSYTDEIAKPSHNKLLPDWSQVSKLLVVGTVTGMGAFIKLNPSQIFPVLLSVPLPNCFENTLYSYPTYPTTSLYLLLSC